MAVRPTENHLALRLPGIGGWHTYLDPSAIQDSELADVQNFSYEKGFLAIREGSTLLYSKPTGETGDPLQVITAKTSDGVEYLIAIYANHFYVRHETTDEWIRINQTYVPAETTLFYGYTNWMNGRGDDRLYVCNGVDDMIRWDICVNTVASAASAGAASVTLTDGSRFPSGGGTLILKSSGGTFFTEAYTSRTGNVFTLTNTLDNNIDAGSPAVTDMIQKASMEIGKHISKHQRRLIVANYYGGETVIFGSVQGSPEDFTIASTIAGAFTQTIADGNGEITALHDFGKFLAIEKEDSIHSLKFQIAADLGSKLTVVEPLLSGDSLGPLDMGSTIKILGRLFYPTRNNGFMSVTPTSSGDSVSTAPEVLSQKISNYIRSVLELGYSRVGFTENKLYWSVARTGSTQNTLVLEYDILRQAWTKHTGWAVKDFTQKNKEVLYLDSGDGSVNQINNGSYNDNNNEYQASASFKRLDYGEIGRPKTQDVIYLQGYMTTASEFYVDVYFNEDGVLGKQTYRINKDTTGLYFSNPITDETGTFVLGEPILGMVSLEGIANLSAFRCYLALSKKKAFYNVQVRVYGSRAAFWGITGMAMNPEIVPIVPHGFLVNPILEE